ncbi:MAG: hypothetical protein ACKVVT_06690 [Dehalococcoidia bacterium]
MTIATAAIDRVHNDGELDPANGGPLAACEGPVPADMYVAGHPERPYAWTNAAQRPPVITFNEIPARGELRAFVGLHEVGHVLDVWAACSQAGLDPATGYALSAAESFLDLAQDTRECKKIKELQQAADPIRDKVFYDYCDYLLDACELFARAYAQYVLETAATPVIEAQAQAFDAASRRFRRGINYRWETTDFSRLRTYFDELLEDLEWCIP